MTIVAFLLPALALYVLFVLFPVVQAAHYSLFKWNGLQPLTDFIGLKNYITAFASDTFTTALSNNVLIIVLSLAIQVPFSLSVAILQSAFSGPRQIPADLLPVLTRSGSREIPAPGRSAGAFAVGEWRRRPDSNR